MAVLGRLLVSSAERLDLPDFLSIDSYTQGDFKYLLRSFVGGEKPYILTGFDVINPEASIGTQNVSIRVSDSVVYYPGSLAGPFFHGLEEGNLQAAPLVPELRKNSTNYVYLTLTTTEAAKDTRAFWDPDKEGGEGGEFTQDVNTQTVLSVDINVSVSSFPENTVPVAKVVVGANFIESIEDARDMMFRLASGGLNPDPLKRYSWREDPTSAYQRTEPNTVMTSALDPNPFQGGDKNIQSLKEWMDAVMTKLAELGGTTYWYEDTSVYNIISVFKDALATSIKSKGYWNSSDLSPGVLTWSEDIVIQSTTDLSEVIVRAGSETLQDNEVLYLNRVRDIAINTGSIAVEFFNGVDHVNGQLGSFENLSKGDWVKKADDPDNYYRRVEEFYAAANKGGGVTAPAAALSIKLSAGYPGISEIKQASYIKGVYLSTEVDIASRDAQEIQDAAGNYYWLAMRSDTILNIDDITSTALACDITGHDGTRATVTSTNHGLQDGQRVTITGSTNFDGTYAVSVEDLDTFYISVSGGPHADELAQSAFYATVTTSARSTDNGLQLESANHGLETDQRVIISDTTNYDGDYQVFPLTDTTFTVAVPSLIANEAAGTSTSVNIYVRTDVGPTRLERGENKSIGEVDGDNLMAFIGMDNDAQTHPNYYIAPSYNTLYDKQNFNTDTTDNLTQRVSKLTAMMADKAQDKTVVQSATGITSYSNIASGLDQLVSFVPGGSFTAVQPGSPGNFSLDLAGTLTLAENQVATYTIDRNSATNLTDLSQLVVYDIEDCPIEENLFVFAYRFTGTKVYLWNGLAIGGGLTPAETPYIQKVNYIDLVTSTLPTSASVTIDGQSLVDGNTILFAELSVDPGVYTVSGIGVAAEWTKVACFQGGTDPLEGSNVNVIDGTSYFDSTWRFDGNRWKPLDGDVIAKARTGFPTESKEQTLISFDDITRTFTIAPQPAPLVEVYENITTGIAGGGGINTYFANEIIFASDTTIDSVLMRVRNFSGYTGNWTLKIYADDGSGRPDETNIIATSDLLDASPILSSFQDVTFTFSGNPTLTSGIKYFFGFDNTSEIGIAVEQYTTGSGAWTTFDGSFWFAAQQIGMKIYSPPAFSPYFDIYQSGVPYRFDSPQQIVIPDIEGSHFIYFNNGVLTSQTTFDFDIIEEWVYVANVYWDADNSKSVLVGDERHGLGMDAKTHEYLHNINGTQINNGFALGNFTTTGDGSADTDAQISIGNGVIRDEDITHSVVHSASPSNIFEQILDPVAELPIWYRDGASGYWREDAAIDAPISPGTSTGSSGWTLQPPITPSNGIAFANNTFVAVNGFSSGFMASTSTDGINFTSKATPADASFQDVAFGNGWFVACGSAGVFSPSNNQLVMRSNDNGNTWVSATSVPFAGNFTGIAYDGVGTWVAVNTFTAVTQAMVSTDDGDTWTGVVMPETASWQSVTYSAGLFVAVANGGGASVDRIATSPDGITWTARPNPDSGFGAGPLNMQLKDVTYGGGLFVAVGFKGGGGGIMTSPDGITWTVASQPSSSFLNAVTYGNGEFVTVSLNSPEVLRSSDGITWTSETSHTGTWQEVVYGNNLFVAVGNSTNYLMTYDTAASGGPTIHYNEYTGSTWQKTEAGDGKFVPMWIFATNDIDEPMVSMMGQEAYDTLGEAQDQADYNSISFGTLPAQEFKVAYRLIYETDSSYSNTYKAKLVDVRDLRQTLDTAAPAYAGSYHGSLSGLLDQHHPASAIYNDDPSLFSGAMSPADTDVNLSLLSIDPWFRQLRIKEHPTNKKRVTISAADALRTEGTTLSQVVKNLLLKFDGAEIDFATGQVFESDGSTPLGIDFTPETIPAGEWQWYSVTLIPSTVNADNTINGQIVVLPGSASGATKELAVKAPFSKGTQLGMIAVQESGGTIADIPQSDIRQLGVGGGSGGGEGDANELLERVKNRLDIAEYDAVTPVIFSSVEEDLTDELNTTADYDVANARYNFELVSDQFTSVQMVDDQFLTEEKDITDVELVAYWDLDSLDDSATYEVSRDGGNEWQTVTMDRIGNSDTYHGRHIFTEEATFTEVVENTAHDGTDLELNDTVALSRSQAFTITNSLTVKELTLGLSVIGTVQGAVVYKVIRDDGGGPSSDPADVLFESVEQDISGLTVGDYDLTVDCTVPLNAGVYHLVIQPNLEYRDNFLTGVNALRVRSNSLDTTPDSLQNDGITWSTSTGGKLVFNATGRAHNLKVRITSGTADVDLNGFAIFYDRDDSFSLISKGYERQIFTFSGDDNFDTFEITEFVPDPILMNVYEIGTGGTYRSGDFTLNGTTVQFPPGTFDKPGETITLEFLQVFKGSMQFDSRNRAILAENALGSVNPSLDLSQPGRGIILRSPDGTLYEITIKDGGTGFDIYQIIP